MLELGERRATAPDDAALHRVILENMAEGVCLIRVSDAVVVYANKHLTGLLGYAPGELEGTPSGALAPGRELAAELRERGEATWEAELVRKDGARLWCRVRTTELKRPGSGSLWIAVLDDITSARAAQEQLRHSERLLRGMVDLLPVGVWLTDEKGRIVSANPAGLKIWQGTRYVGPEEFSDYRAWWVDTGKRLDAEDWALSRAILKGESSSGELLRIRCFDGTFKTIINSAAPLRDEQGKIVGAVAVNEDVTDLKEAEARFQGIVSHAFDAIVALDGQQRIEVFNRGAEVAFGYAAADVVGLPVDVLFPEAVRGQQREQLQRFSSGDTSAGPLGTRLQLLGLRSNAEEFPADAALSLSSGGGPALLTLTLRDIAERTRTEDEQRFFAEVGGLLGSSLDLDHILEQVVSLAVRFLADYCAVDLVEEERLRRIKVSAAHPGNARIAQALQQTRLDPRGKAFPAVAIRAGQPGIHPQATDEVLATNAQSDAHLRLLRRMRVSSVMSLPLIAHGRTVGAITFFSSRPGRHYGPDHLRIAEQLAWRAAAAVENALLYRTAQRASAARDELLAVVAHDLRTPLNAIALTAQVLTRKLRGGHTATATESAAIIYESTRQMDRLISDLLDVARIESGAFAVRPRRSRPEELVRAAVEDARAALEHHELQLRIAPGLPFVVADEGRIRQVLWNLLTNAAKFTPPAGVITVGAEPKDGSVHFWVQDTGPGIAAEHLEHVFDRFRQLHRGDRRGVGLGLSICHALVEAHHGRIWAQSTPGQGSTFHFTLPRETPPGAEAGPGEPAPRLVS